VHFSASLLPSAWLLAGHLLYALVLAWGVWQTPWHYLKNAQNMWVLLGACIGLWLFWRVAGTLTILPGLEFHLLLVTSITLMFGWAYALLCVSLAQLGLTLGGQAEGVAYAWNTLINGAVPVVITYLSFKLVERWLPRHFFIYIYLCAFLAGALSMLFSRLAGIGLLLASGAYSLDSLPPEYWAVLPIMLFPEAFLNGGVMTVLVVFRPEWVSSFSDALYLRGK